MRPSGEATERLPIGKDEYTRLLTSLRHVLRFDARQRLQNAYTLLYHTGCRIGEIRKWTGDTLLEAKKHRRILLRARETKTNQGRTIRLTDQALEDFEQRVRVIENNLLFPGKGKTVMSASSLQRLVNTHMGKVLGAEYSSHSFRAGVATRLQKEAGLKVAQKVLGHASFKTTLLYDRPTEGDIMAALSRAYG